MGAEDPRRRLERPAGPDRRRLHGAGCRTSKSSPVSASATITSTRKWAGERGIVVTHTPGVLDDEVADLAMALTIMAVRRLPQAERFLRAGEWPKGGFPLSASLRGRTMGILGLGRIGKAIAARARSFGLEVVYHGRHAQPDVAYRFYPSLADMAKACDILMVAAPGGPGTRHIVDAALLRALGPDGVLVNIARGTLVDEQALIEALSDRNHSRRRPRRLRQRAECSGGVARARQRGAAAPRRLGVGQDPARDGRMRGAKPRRLVGRPAAADAGAGDAVAGALGQERPGSVAAAGSGRRAKAKAAADRTGIIGDIVASMREWWDLPADCNDGELFTYAEMLLDRLEAGDARDTLCRFLAEIQKDRLDMAESDAPAKIVDRAFDLAGASG